MATAAQIEANRKNAALSHGPVTPEGKARSFKNHLKFGLFSTQNCVQPHETEEYAAVSQSLWNGLSPAGPVEELLATEIVRASWRLRRCVLVEATLASQPEAPGSETPLIPLCDPMLDDGFALIQAAVDRARAQANAAVCRCLDKLRNLQTDRWLRSQILPAGFDHASVGLADTQRVLAGLARNERLESTLSRAPLGSPAVPVPPTSDPAATHPQSSHPSIIVPPESLPVPPAAGPAATIRTQFSAAAAAERPSSPVSIPRNAPCPCHSGQKYKRCCGRSAQPLLHTAAPQAVASSRTQAPDPRLPPR